MPLSTPGFKVNKHFSRGFFTEKKGKIFGKLKESRRDRKSIKPMVPIRL